MPGKRKEREIAGKIPSALTHPPQVPQTAGLRGQTAQKVPAAANSMRNTGTGSTELREDGPADRARWPDPVLFSWRANTKEQR